MKRIVIMLALCVTAVVAFSAVAAGSASAEPLLLLKLTKGTFPATATGLGGTGILETAGGAKVTCTEVHSKVTFEDAHLGKILLLFLKCKVEAKIGITVSGPCETTGGSEEIPAESIHLLNWGFHLGGVKLKSNGKEDPGVLILVPLNGKTPPEPEFVFECKTNIGNLKIVVKGEGVVGLIMTLAGGVPAPNVKLSSFNIVFKKGTAKGEQEDNTFLLPLKSNEEMVTQLKSKIGTLPEENASQESTTPIENFENSAKEATEVEIEEG